MYDNTERQPRLLPLPAIIIVGNFVVLNIFLAILLDLLRRVGARRSQGRGGRGRALAIQEAAKAAEKITANADLLKESTILRDALSRKGSYAGGEQAPSAAPPPAPPPPARARQPTTPPSLFRGAPPPSASARRSTSQMRAEERRTQASGTASRPPRRVGDAAKARRPRTRGSRAQETAELAAAAAQPWPRHDAARDEGLPRVRRGQERRDRRGGAPQGAARARPRGPDENIRDIMATTTSTATTSSTSPSS